jgi:hypothetical protein
MLVRAAVHPYANVDFTIPSTLGDSMRYRMLLLGTFALSACGQKTYSTAVNGSTSAGPEATFACIKKQLGELGYKQTTNDVDELRLSATKLDYDTRRADVTFRRMHNKLDVDVGAESNGQTGIKVLGRTFAEYSTHRGPTEQEEKPSEQVQSDSKKLLERCRS